MIRLTLLTLFVSFLAVYAWKDWYKSLCGLVILMAVIEHPDMPKSIMGVQGLSPWNLLLANIVLAWLVSRSREGLTWDMPRKINVLLLIYLAVVVIGFFRMMHDINRADDLELMAKGISPSKGGLWSEYFVNTIKWSIPGLLFFSGCRSRSRFNWGITSVLGVYVFLAVQVIKWMPLGYAVSGSSLSRRSLKLLTKQIGYHRVDLSTMLAGASWAIFSARALVKRAAFSRLVVVTGLMVFFAQALTGGRAGYATWIMVGMLLGVIRWRKFLLLGPVAIAIIALIIPGVIDRFTEGINMNNDYPAHEEEVVTIGGAEVNLRVLTAGRSIAWPLVLEKIGEAPMFGYGRIAMRRTGLSSFIQEKYKDIFPHPHNAYLQLLLDNGIIGFLPIMFFYLLVIRYGVSLLCDTRNVLFVAVGGVTLSLVLAQMVASIGSQTFYLREGTVGMWCAICLMFRVHVERARADEALRKDPSKTMDDLIWERAR